jgi:small subunit ribosomal protein S4
MKGNTGFNLLLMLERRLDNVAFRMGFASSRNEARQLVRHGHFQVNGKKVNLPSFAVKVGDVISLIEGSKQIARIVTSLDAVERRGIPAWVELNRAEMKGTVKAFPSREELTMPMQEQLVVELYSK